MSEWCPPSVSVAIATIAGAVSEWCPPSVSVAIAAIAGAISKLVAILLSVLL